jgi:hypothetical protein
MAINKDAAKGDQSGVVINFESETTPAAENDPQLNETRMETGGGILQSRLYITLGECSESTYPPLPP